jgi:vanillate O-demethylase monooxygenase subunit
VDRHGLLWWWPGDPALAQPDLIPDYSALARAHPDGSFRGYLPTQCNYELLVDNILDLTHADYLHAGTLGNGSLTRAKAHITDIDERSLNVTWVSSGERAPPAFDAHLRHPGQPADQWTEVTWTAPGNMLLRVGATLQGEGRSRGVDVLTAHVATPETGSHSRVRRVRLLTTGQADVGGAATEHGRRGLLVHEAGASCERRGRGSRAA